jgi:hypothetical protein
MPRFYFHIFDGRNQRDDDGTELSNFHEARVKAIRYAGEVLKDDAHCIALGEDWHMDVTDEAGLILLRLDFSVQVSSAIALSAETKRHSVTPPDLKLVR